MSVLDQQPIMAIGEHIRRLRDESETYTAALLADWEAKVGHPITGDLQAVVLDDWVCVQCGEQALRILEIPGGR
jgi:hypothetical protein